jgi:hypothetical protein
MAGPGDGEGVFALHNNQQVREGQCIRGHAGCAHSAGCCPPMAASA